MKTIYIKTQKEFDALPDKFEEYTEIVLKDCEELIFVSKNRGNSSVVAWDNSHVKARGNSHVEAWGNSSVVAWGNSHVEAWGNSHVKARGNSHVEAWGNSHVEARGNSHVEAWGNSSVVAWGNSSVVAWGNSHVKAWGNVGVHLTSDYATVVLFMFSVCWKLAKGKIEKKSKTATIITPKVKSGLAGWFENNAIEEKSKVVLYKKVSKDFKTQEGTKNETLWEIGKVVEHPNWSPEGDECGEGKFHAVSRPYFADEFRNEPGDKYVAIEIDKKDLYAWPNPDYPYKIGFRKGKILHEVDKFGKIK